MTVWSLLKHHSLENSKYQLKTKATILILSLLLRMCCWKGVKKSGYFRDAKLALRSESLISKNLQLSLHVQDYPSMIYLFSYAGSGYIGERQTMPSPQYIVHLYYICAKKFLKRARGQKSRGLGSPGETADHPKTVVAVSEVGDVVKTARGTAKPRIVAPRTATPDTRSPIF